MLLRRAFIPALASCASTACGFPSGGVPDFKGKTIDGESFSKESLRGKPVLIQFWATWCGYCRRDQPSVESIAAAHRGRLTVLAVSVREPERTVRKYLSESPRRSMVVLSKDTNLTDIFNPEGFPHYIMLSAEGRPLAEQRGSAGMPGLLRLLERAGL